MATKSRKSQGLSSTLKNLTITSPPPSQTKPPAPDSWDEDAASSSSSTPTSRPTTPQPISETPGPPPPTPSSPSHSRKKSTDWASFSDAYSYSTGELREGKAWGVDTRPEKSNAAAGRMIAGALGVRVNKTEEGVRYEKAVREKERKRREREKEEGAVREREKEEARRRVWDG